MKRKNIIIIIVMVVMIWVLLIVGIVFCIQNYVKKIYENPLENISSESEQVPNFVVYGELHSKYGEVYIESVFAKQDENIDLQEILCVKDEKAYFVYSTSYEDTYCWEIGSIDLKTLEVQSHGTFVEPAEYYKVAEFNDDYKMQNGYYFEDQIILTDHKDILVYDLEQQCSKIYVYDEYDFPEKQIYGEALDTETIKIKKQGISQEYSLEKMAEQSDSIEQIYELKERKIWNGDSPLNWFFSEYSVQVAEDKVYAVCQCLNSQGYAYAVILEYMESTDSWRYVTSIRTAAGDIVHGRCYVVP